MIFGEKFSILPVQIDENVYKIYALDILVFIIFIFWLLRLKVGQNTFFHRFIDKKNIWLTIFFVIMILTLIRSFFLGINTELAIGTFKNYSYVLIYFLIIDMFGTREGILRLLKTLFYGGVLIIGFVIWGFIDGKGLWSESTPGLRYLSGLHTYYMSFSLIILFVLGVKREYFYNKFITGFTFAIQLVGVIGSMFRHLWLAFFVSVAVIWVMMRGQEKKNAIKSALFFVGIATVMIASVLWVGLLFGKSLNIGDATFISSLGSRLQTLTTTGYEIESAAGWRLATWKVVIVDYFITSPVAILLGVGFGQQFILDYRNYIDLIDVRNIHNDILGILVQVGLIGFIPFVLFHVAQIRKLRAVLKERNKDEWIALVITAFLIFAFFGAFFAIYISFTGTALFYWLVLAMVTIIADESLKKEELSMNKPIENRLIQKIDQVKTGQN